jgi:uncharacterized Zn finger protein
MEEAQDLTLSVDDDEAVSVKFRLNEICLRARSKAIEQASVNVEGGGGAQSICYIPNHHCKHEVSVKLPYGQERLNIGNIHLGQGRWMLNNYGLAKTWRRTGESQCQGNVRLSRHLPEPHAYHAVNLHHYAWSSL